MLTSVKKEKQQTPAELLQIIKKRGKKELDTNPFFTDLNELMRHDNKFRIFYDKYCKDSSDIKTVLIYMKLYETLELEYKGRMISAAIKDVVAATTTTTTQNQSNSNTDINNTTDEEEVLICAIKELMSNESTRKSIISSFNRYFTDNQHTNPNNKYVLDILQSQQQQQKDKQEQSYPQIEETEST